MSAKRQVKQRLESLARAGVDRLPKARGKARTRRPAEKAPVEVEETSRVSARAEAGPKDLTASRPTPGGSIASTPPPTAPRKPAHAVGGRSLFAEADEALGELVPPAERPALLDEMREVVSTCPKCAVLVATRTKTVFGEGSPTARLMFIGEAPGADEDRTGRPFVGRAGQLLTDMITKGMGLSREDVYIANILKCRPPENRPPLPDEVGNCRGYLERQIDIIRPEFLCLLGRTAAGTLLDTSLAMRDLRGRWFQFRGIRTMVTYHPAYLLRSPGSKRDTWEDLKLLMAEMGLDVPRSGR